MNRRTLLQSAAVSIGASALVSGQQDQVDRQRFPGTKFQTYCRCLPDYLSRLSRESVRLRHSALARLNTAGAIEARQRWARETLWRLIGGELEKTNLNPSTVGELQQPGFRIEKLIYESRPGLFIPANLYIPSGGSAPHPAVLFQCGHYWTGKAYPSYQRCCQGLAQLGFVVLAFDPIGQGERISYLDETGTRSRLKEVDTEHTLPGMQYLLVGDTATRFQLWDAIRSLDVLVSRPEVDARRVASVGHSGGATLTMLLAAADSRLAAAAVCMGNLENVAAEPFLSPGATDDAEQDFVGGGPLGFDRWDLLYPFAPKPLLVWPSDRDYFATYSPNYIDNAWQEYGKLKRVYQVLGQANQLGWSDTPLPHALAYPDRLLVYNWFSRWLQGKQTAITTEPRVSPLPPESLRVTDSGSVVRSLQSKTPFSLLRERKPKLSDAPTSATILPGLLGIDATADTRAAVVAQVRTAHVHIQQLEVKSEPEVAVPAFLLAADRTPADAPVLLALDDSLAQQLWFEPEADDVIAENCPAIVCAADVRGIGTLVPQFSPGDASYEGWHQQEENYAWSSLYFGRPLVGQRVRDILCLAAALRNLPETANRRVHLAARGRLVFPALLAAALDTKITSLYLSGGLAAFRSVIETEMPNEPLANYVPGWLDHTDIPELVASLAPRRIVWSGAGDASGARISAARGAELFAAAVKNKALDLREAEDWSARTLLANL